MYMSLPLATLPGCLFGAGGSGGKILFSDWTFDRFPPRCRWSLWLVQQVTNIRELRERTRSARVDESGFELSVLQVISYGPSTEIQTYVPLH